MAQCSTFLNPLLYNKLTLNPQATRAPTTTPMAGLGPHPSPSPLTHTHEHHPLRLATMCMSRQVSAQEHPQPQQDSACRTCKASRKHAGQCVTRPDRPQLCMTRQGGAQLHVRALPLWSCSHQLVPCATYAVLPPQLPRLTALQPRVCLLTHTCCWQEM